MYIVTVAFLQGLSTCILTIPPDRFVKKCYLMMVNEDRLGRTNSNWASELKELLFMNGFGYI